MTRDEAEDIKRHFDVIAEQLQSSIAQVAEGVVLNGERLDRVERRLDEHDARFDQIDAKLAAHDARFDQVDAKLAAHDARFDQVDAKLAGHDARFDSHDTRFDSHDIRFDGLEGEMREGFTEVKSMIKLSYAEIDGRLTHLEREVTDLRSRLEAVEAKLAS